MDKNFWLNKFNILIYKKNNLIYIPTLKNACTFYRTLCMYNNWKTISWYDIDWHNHHVISFIGEPKRRYFKGLAQDLFNINFLEDKEVFYELLKYSTKTLNDTTLILTVHSTPLSIVLGDKVEQIDWIPIHKNIDNYKYFKKLCLEYGIETRDDSPTIEKHESIPQKEAFFDVLYNNMADIETNLYFNLVMSKDVDLYNRVLSKFNPVGSNWQEISWLNKNVTKK